MKNQETKVEVPITADLSQLSEKTRSMLHPLRQAMELIREVYYLQCQTLSYPTDLTKEELAAYALAHPEKKSALYSPFTNIVRNGTELEAVPYCKLYKTQLNRAANLLEVAAKDCEDKLFANFLKAQAKAMRDNSFSDADILWISTVGTELEMTIGPYEEYEDRFLDIKRSFESFLSIPLKEENKRVARYQQAAREFDREMSRMLSYTPSGSAVNMVVVDQLYAAGRSADKYIPMAFNLPNDFWIRQKHGSKQVFLRNIMKAKFEHLILPIAERIAPEHAHRFNTELLMKFVIGHELSHGLGVYCKNGLEEFGSALEEAKADVFGILFLYYLEGRGEEELGTADNVAVLHAIDCFRQLYKDPKEAHGFGARIQLNWFIEQKAVRLENGMLQIDESKLKAAVHTLAMNFAYVALGESRDTAQQFVEMWGKEIPEADKVLANLKGIPQDIQPVFQNF